MINISFLRENYERKGKAIHSRLVVDEGLVLTIKTQVINSISILKYTFVPLKRTFIEKFPRFRTKLSESIGISGRNE